jgi:hypothetical protein
MTIYNGILHLTRRILADFQKITSKATSLVP